MTKTVTNILKLSPTFVTNIDEALNFKYILEKKREKLWSQIQSQQYLSMLWSWFRYDYKNRPEKWIQENFLPKFLLKLVLNPFGRPKFVPFHEFGALKNDNLWLTSVLAQ